MEFQWKTMGVLMPNDAHLFQHQRQSAECKAFLDLAITRRVWAELSKAPPLSTSILEERIKNSSLMLN